jgi:hypothetical protein
MNNLSIDDFEIYTTLGILINFGFFI